MKNSTSRLNDTFQRLWMPLIVSLCFAAVVFACLWGFGSWDPLEIDTSASTGVAQKLLCCGGIAALLSGLIFVLSREALREPNDIPEERPVWYYPVVSGLLSLGAMMVAYSFLGMWPFGEKTGMVVDMHHQYAPLLSGLRDAILGGDLSLYNFEVGLGANYLSLGAYYLASPLNLLLLLFPEQLLAEGILFITLLKNALCGAMFALCMQQIYGKRDLSIPITSLMYSLMMYLLAYSWNIMWLDVVMVLPLVVYGFERLMRTGKFLTYVLSLAYALFANYYIAFMLCIFLVLYYITYCLREQRDGKELGVSFARFAGFSVLAAGLVAALLIPVYFALKLTSAAESGLPEITNTLDIFQLLGRHLAGTSPTIRSGNLPNLYCGVLSAVCVPLFALNKKLTLRMRLSYLLLWLIMAFSLLINWSDLMWHGLHAPNDLPYRFSFLYSFVLLILAHKTLQNLEGIGIKQVFAVLAGAVAYLMIEERFGDEVYSFAIIYVNLALVVVYSAVLALAASKKLRRRLAYAMLLLVVGVELTVNGGYGILQVNNNEYFTRHDDYIDNDITEALHMAVDRAQALGDEKYGAGTYRMEFYPRRTCVDTALFHYQGITNFASSNYYTTTKLMGGWGYAINGVNSHLYHSFMPFTDSLLGIRYVVTDKDLSSIPQLTKVDTVAHGKYTYHIYENADALSLGYVTDASIADYDFTKYDPIGSLEDLFSKLNDTYLALFEKHPISAVYGTGAELGYDLSGFRVQPMEDGTPAEFTATVQKAGQVFVYADCMAADSMSVRYDDTTLNASPHEPYLMNIGMLEEGETITLQVTAKQSCSGNFYVVTLNEDAYTAGMKILADEQLKITSMRDNHIVGTVNAGFDGTMMTSIPYDAGWTVRVDGEIVKTYGINQSLLAFDVAAGEHTVELVYYPAGWWIGLGVSAVSLIVLVVLLIVFKCKRAKKQVKTHVDMSAVLPVQEGFSVDDEPKTEIPAMPDTFEELTENTEDKTEEPEETEPQSE